MNSVSLSHAGVFATDVEKMVGFYTRFFGFVVSDRGIGSNGKQIVFMTSDPREHHQFVIVEGRPKDVPFNVVNQISFRVDSLATLRKMHARLAHEPVQKLGRDGPMSHGNALSVYFHDPEGNRIEILIDTPWYVSQPSGISVDFSMPDDALWTWLEARARESPGFKPRADWEKEISKKLAEAH